MAVPKRKTSKMKIRSRKASKRFEGIETGVCQVCQASTLPHRVCPSCGNYKGKQVIAVAE